MNNVMNTKYEDIKTSVQSEPNYLIITTEEIHEDDKRLEVKRINKHTGAYVSKVSATYRMRRKKAWQRSQKSKKSMRLSQKRVK